MSFIFFNNRLINSNHIYLISKGIDQGEHCVSLYLNIPIDGNYIYEHCADKEAVDARFEFLKGLLLLKPKKCC